MHTPSHSWILLASAALCAACGEKVPEAPPEPREVRDAGTADAVVPDLDDEMAQTLRAIGYAGGTEEASEESTVVVHDPERVSPGPVLFVSGHEPVAYLIDNEGRELHRWRADPLDFWPRDVALSIHGGMHFFRRAYLQPGGELLVIFEGYGMVRLDRDSNVLWQTLNLAHHAAEVRPDGSTLVLTRREMQDPESDPPRWWLVDYVTELSPAGEVVREVSILDALLASEYAELAKEPHPDLPPRGLRTFGQGDLHHTNALRTLERDHPQVPGLRKGHLLLSSAHLCAIFALDMDAQRVTWLHRGDFLVQHEPIMLPGGNILLFDNNTREHGSRAIELDPASGEVVWQYPPAGHPEGFFSDCCGTSYRLPNGNTLVTVTAPGRILEVTPAGETVWEYRNPYRMAAAPDVVAYVFDAMRLPADTPLDWLGEAR